MVLSPYVPSCLISTLQASREELIKDVEELKSKVCLFTDTLQAVTWHADRQPCIHCMVGGMANVGRE